MLFTYVKMVWRVIFAANIVARGDVAATAQKSNVAERGGRFELPQKSNDLFCKKVVVSFMSFWIPLWNTLNWMMGFISLGQFVGKYWRDVFPYPFCMNNAYAAVR